MGTTFVIGSGAAVVSGIPTIAHFRDASRALLDTNFVPPERREIFELGHQVWDKWGRNLDVEEMYVLADLKSRVWGGTNNRIQEAKAVQAMIAETIQQLAHDDGRPVHDEFVNHLKTLVGATLMTTNWDITLDNALLRGNVELNYNDGAHPLLWGQMPQDAGKGLPFLKLHGSLNWGRCVCKEWTAFRDEKVAAAAYHDNQFKCGVCDKAGLEPAFVPPLAQKMEETGTPLQSIWQRAFRLLRQSELVVLVGYSLPRTDAQVEMLLFDALNRQDSKVAEVHVVAPADAERDRRLRRLQAKLDREIPFFQHDITYEAWVGRSLILQGGRDLRAAST